MSVNELAERLLDFFKNNSTNDFILPRQGDVFARCKNGYYTFGIPGGDYLNFYEEFTSCILETGLEGNKPYLYFSCKELSEEFINLCLTSFTPAEKRKEITSDPAAWFEKISSVFGNTNSSSATSDKIAELYIFWQMKRFGLRNISFGGYNKKSLRDIQCEGFEVEVKSTLNHHVWPIYTNAEQIGNKKESGNCYFILCRLENAETMIGENCYSLDSLKHELSGYSGCEEMLSKLPHSTSLLNKMYIIRDIKVFSVDGNFPSVTLTGCPGGAILKNFVLELNPAALNAETLEEFLLKKGGAVPVEADQVQAIVLPEQNEVADGIDGIEVAPLSPPPSKNKVTILDAAIKVLKRYARPMNAKEIVKYMTQDSEYTFGSKAQTPQNTVSMVLRNYMNSSAENICIRQPARGKFEYFAAGTGENTVAAEVNSNSDLVKNFLIDTYGEEVLTFFPGYQVGIPVYDRSKDEFFLYLPFAAKNKDNFIGITQDGKFKNKSCKTDTESALKMLIAVRDTENDYLFTILPTQRVLTDMSSNNLIIDTESGSLFFEELKDQNRFRLEWAIAPDEVEENDLVCEKDFYELKYLCEHRTEDNTGFSSFKVYEFDRLFVGRNITKLIVPGKTWDYDAPKTGAKVLHDFFEWFRENHQAILVAKTRSKDKKDARYAEYEEDLKEKSGVNLYKISENCYFNQRLSLADLCKEMQKLLKEAYGDELDESSGIGWIKK